MRNKHILASSHGPLKRPRRDTHLSIQRLLLGLLLEGALLCRRLLLQYRRSFMSLHLDITILIFTSFLFFLLLLFLIVVVLSSDFRIGSFRLGSLTRGDSRDFG